MSMRSMGSIWQATLSGIGSSDGCSRAQAPIPRHDPPHYASGFPQDVSTRIAPVTSHALQAIGHVGRQTARRNEDDVEALLVLAIGRLRLTQNSAARAMRPAWRGVIAASASS